jgi:putative heme-binding domain-containing protein
MDELLAAIVFPSWDVAASHRPVSFLMRDGQSVTGLVVLDSARETIVQTALFSTERLVSEAVVDRQPARGSFMPEGLLDNLPPEALADLFSFLRTLDK